jgi:hypothetical protein
MYTFHPLASIPVDHTGFGIVVTFCIIALIMCLFVERESFFVYFFFAMVVAGFAYGVSYHWTNQDAKTFVNQKVIAEFQGYQPEGYNESRTSGKSTRRVDVHNIYVVYKVNGNPVILPAQTGQEYPKSAVLYKN